jgi:hypothetical protein
LSCACRGGLLGWVKQQHSMYCMHKLSAPTSTAAGGCREVAKNGRRKHVWVQPCRVWCD